jgi:CheY-like chemotaxis protein
VFEPFFTTKPVGKGTGLGLSQVYGFARQSGGAVAIDSEPGQGTRITIYLPRSHRSTVPADPARRAMPCGEGEGSILVVEDNAEVAQVTATLLSELGYRVVRAATASDALDRIEHGSFDLVFSDIVMPGAMDGFRLAQEIKSRHPHVAVVLTSGFSNVAPAAELEFPILRKPFQLAALDKAVREALGRCSPGSKPAAPLQA